MDVDHEDMGPMDETWSINAGPFVLWRLYRVPLLMIMGAFWIIRTLLYLRRRYVVQLLSPRLTIPRPVETKLLSQDVSTSIRKGPRRILGNAKKSKFSSLKNDDPQYTQIQVLVFFSSLAGSTEKKAHIFAKQLTQFFGDTKPANATTLLQPVLLDLAYVDYDDYFITAPRASNTRYFYLMLMPSYNIDTILDNFLQHLKETHHDFRIDTSPLSSLLGYSVFGFGDREGWPTEEEGFCSQARETDKWMAKLTSRKRAYPLGMGDANGDAEERLTAWGFGVQDVIMQIAETGHLGEGVTGSGDAVESDMDEVEEEEGTVSWEEKKTSKRLNPTKPGEVNDLEDLGGTLSDLPRSTNHEALETDFTTTTRSTKLSTSSVTLAAPKEMVPKNSPTYTALTKQGYSIVGTHSGVKICRWTKSALRGRGSCYKYSFYGIASHQCMETTPSLSCSNKCVFCWRHGTNPVGTTWRWVIDPPELIFTGVKENHYKKIKMLRGVPGVRAERYAEAMQIRHCALSLVGEPIFYPFINQFTAMLHAEHISSFLVCNAQHPDQLASLKPVTQLYVSIDASNRESLRKIDRPLHRDFWERFQRCLDILRERRFEQRTVFRLTLVKGFNIEDEVTGYVDLIEKGLPCFVEIKGVTYCGTSSSAGAGLTMQNVPFYEEVCDFVRALDEELDRRGLGYGIAAEHAHSCCVLLASERFRRAGKWCTRIDYERFFVCLESEQAFGPEDYMGEDTPEWALWGRGGFDPRDERVYRKGKGAKEITALEVKGQGMEESRSLVEKFSV